MIECMRHIANHLLFALRCVAVLVAMVIILAWPLSYVWEIGLTTYGATLCWSNGWLFLGPGARGPMLLLGGGPGPGFATWTDDTWAIPGWAPALSVASLAALYLIQRRVARRLSATRRPRLLTAITIWLTAAWLISPISALGCSVGPVSIHSRHGLVVLRVIQSQSGDDPGFYIASVMTDGWNFSFWEWSAWWDAPFTSAGLALATFPFWLLLLPFVIWISIRAICNRGGPRAGHCLRCDYDLTGNTSGFCSECGAKITEIESRTVED